MNGPLLVDQLVEVLAQIGDLLPDDKAAWDEDVRTRLAVERLWITAGNVAEAYRAVAGLDLGTDPWAELYRFRNLLAHALPGDVSTDRIWTETTTDLPRLIDAVRAGRLNRRAAPSGEVRGRLVHRPIPPEMLHPRARPRGRREAGAVRRAGERARRVAGVRVVGRLSAATASRTSRIRSASACQASMSFRRRPEPTEVSP